MDKSADSPTSGFLQRQTPLQSRTLRSGFILSIFTKYYKSLILFCKIENTQKTTTVCDIIMAKV